MGQRSIQFSKNRPLDHLRQKAAVADLDLDAGADRIDLGGTIRIAIATASGTVAREARILGGRDWVRLGAIEMGLDCLRRFLQGLPIDERTDFEKR